MKINMIILSIIFIGCGFDLLGIPYGRWFASISLVFIIGWNATFLFREPFSLVERVMLAIIISLIGVPFLLATVVWRWGIVLTPVVVTLASVWIGLWGLTYRKQKHWGVKLPPELGWIGLVWAAFLGGMLIIYPFIPEADPYAFIQLIEKTLETRTIENWFYRPFFTLLTATVTLVGDIPLSMVFKYGFPLLSILLILPCFAFMQRLSSVSRTQKILISLVPISLPVIGLESVIARPQLIIMTLFLPLIYFWGVALERRSLSLSLFLFGMSLGLFFYHEMAVILMMVSLMILGVMLWPYIKKQPILLTIVIIAITLAIWELMTRTGMANQLRLFVLTAKKMFLPVRFDWWFLDSYTNADGVQIGWSGRSWMLYYGYNLGVLVPVLVIIGLLKRDPLPRILWAAGMLFVIFFALAEIFPRFGVSFFPDRAWPFVSLALCVLLIPRITSWLGHRPTRIKFLLPILLISMGLSWYLTDRKQGWVTRNEYQAAQFLRENTPENSIVLSQGGNGPLINFYANRQLASRNIFTPNMDEEKLTTYLENFYERLSRREQLEQEYQQLTHRLAEINTAQASATGNLLVEYITQAHQVVTRRDIVASELNRTPPAKRRPVYILYSRDKFTTLYANREWWRMVNYADAHFTTIESSPNLRLIYNQGGVRIWQLVED